MSNENAIKQSIGGTKWNLSGIRDWQTLGNGEIAKLITNMMRIGMPDLNEDTIKHVWKRTQVANEHGLQIPFMAPISNVSYDELKRWLGFSSNIAPVSPQKWFVGVRKLFPHIYDFAKVKEAAEAQGWRLEDLGETFWRVHNINTDKERSQYLLKHDEYLTEKSAWQECMVKGFFNA